MPPARPGPHRAWGRRARSPRRSTPCRSPTRSRPSSASLPPRRLARTSGSEASPILGYLPRVTVSDLLTITDRAAIVTGAGRGIGAASALALAEAGADVVLAARTKDQLDEVAAQVEALGRKAVVVPTDANDNDAVAALADACID